MTAAQLRAAIAQGKASPIYLLESDDAPSRLELAHAFLALVDDDLQPFNIAAFHGREASTAADREQMLSAIVSAARTLPMMAPRRVLFVHDADALLTPRRGKDEEPAEPAAGKRRAKATTPAEDFEAYVERPERLTTLVLDAPSLDRNRRITKLLLKHAVVVNCGELKTPEDVQRWVAARLDRDEMTIEPAAIRALIDAVGIDLPRIRGEVEKLVLYAAGESTITAAHVSDAVARIDDPSGVFALIDFVRNGNAGAAVREIDALFESGSSGPMILGLIRAAVAQLRPDARARQALRRVLETDLAIKSSQGEPRFVLERLVVEVCGGPIRPPRPVRRSWA